MSALETAHLLLSLATLFLVVITQSHSFSSPDPKDKYEHHLVVPAKSHAPSPLRLWLPRANLSPLGFRMI
jgi:hypothetical protein